MKNEKQVKIANCDSRAKKMKYFYTIEDFPKFKILEENYQGILNELLSVINKEKVINLAEDLNQRTNAHFDKNDFIYVSSEDKIGKFQSSNFGYDHNKNEKEDKITKELDEKIIEHQLYTNNDNKGKTNLENNCNNNYNDEFDENNIKSSNYKIYVNEKEDFTSELIEHHEKTDKSDKESNQPSHLINPKNALNEIKSITCEASSSTEDSFTTFEPWVEKNLYSESNEEGWDVAPLMIGGVKIPERCAKFPFLASLIAQISGVVSASFSMLKPGTHIVPHKGYDDYSEKMFRYHLGIIVPPGDVGIRVETDFQKWENGKSFVFDDFLIHEAWNFSSRTRIVLIIDFLKDETKVPENVKFFDANFNKSIKGYLNNSDTNVNDHVHNKNIDGNFKGNGDC